MKDTIITGVPFTDETRANNQKPQLDVEKLIKDIFDGEWHSQYHNVVTHGFYKVAGYQYNLKPFLKRFLISIGEIGCKQGYFPDIADLKKWYDDIYEDEPLEIVEPSKIVPDGCLVVAKFKDGAERFYKLSNPLSQSRSDTDWIFSRIEEKEDEKPISVSTVVIEELN